MAHIIDTLGDMGIFTSLLLGLHKTGLDDLLQGTTSYTIFAPTDAAFDLLSDAMYTSLFNYLDRLGNVLQFHIVPGIYTTSHLPDNICLSNLQGTRLLIQSALNNQTDKQTVSAEPHTLIAKTAPIRRIMINTTPIIQGDINADNGIIHAIDRVMLSPDILLE